jgi:type I restriction enzyme R subunit
LGARGFTPPRDHRASHGAAAAAGYYPQLTEHVDALHDEAERHLREGLTEDKLELCYLLKKDSMTQDETQRRKLAAKRLLHHLMDEAREVLVQKWYKFQQTQKQLRAEIKRLLDEGLPESYERALFKQNCDNVFELLLDYASHQRKWAA